MGGFEENADVICLSTYQSWLESKQQDKSTCCFELLFFFREVNKYLHAKQIYIIKGTLFYAT